MSLVPRRVLVAAAAALAPLGAGAVAPAAAQAAIPSTAPAAASSSAPAGPVGAADVCPPAKPGEATCLSVKLTHLPLQAATAKPTAVRGFKPTDLQSAYKLTSAAKTGGAGQTVAVVDAFDNPKAEADLAVYRKTMGLPPCTTANGCFRKVNQDGAAAPLPPADTMGWALEISLDLQMVSAICPRCHVLLVEATNPTFNSLGTGVASAARLGAQVISNSYGSSADLKDATLGHFYNQPGHAVVASSGDNGFGVAYPASSRFVTSVGGTTLRRSSTARGWTETVWNRGGAPGSGCSRLNAKPSWQHDPGCAGRTVSDVSAVADPFTGVAVFDSFESHGWTVVGGTSASAPIIAGVYGLTGRASSTVAGSTPYAHPSALFDVTSGRNGSCGGSYLCTAKAGFDGPTGLGTPNGIAAFTP